MIDHDVASSSKQIIQYLAVEGSKRERAAGKIEVIGIYGLWAPIENNDNDDYEAVRPMPMMCRISL